MVRVAYWQFHLGKNGWTASSNCKSEDQSVGLSGSSSTEAQRRACRKQKSRADGTAEAERVPRWRKVLLWLGIALLLVFVFFLLIISLIASFNPNTVQSQHHG